MEQIRTHVYKKSKNVFHQNKYRCRDGAPDQVAASKPTGRKVQELRRGAET